LLITITGITGDVFMISLIAVILDLYIRKFCSLDIALLYQGYTNNILWCLTSYRFNNRIPATFK